MSHKTYPRFGSSTSRPRKSDEGVGECNQCGIKLYPGEMQVFINLEYNYMRGDDDVICVCPACAEKPNLNKMILLTGGDPDARWSFDNKPDPQIREKRYDVAKDDFSDAAALAKQSDLELTRKTESHYQLRDRKSDYLLNLYPGNGRIYADKNHARPPMLRPKFGD